MNESIEKYARASIKIALTKCTEAEQHLFKRMYSPNNTDIHIDAVVDNMPADKLDWALSQCERTLKKKL